MTDDFEAITQAMVDFLKTNATALGLVVDDIYYGDMELIARTPTVTVESGPATFTLVGAPRRTDNVFNVYILVYFSKVQDVQVTRKECDQKAQLIKKKIDTFPAIGNVIHGYVRAIEPGYATRGRELLRAARITFEGTSRTQLT